MNSVVAFLLDIIREPFPVKVYIGKDREGWSAYNDCEVEQLDVKTAVLDGDMKEEIYMDEPDGNSNSNGRVCLLKKALHGLKQAPRS
ncbi:hypothetical protein AXG93_4012s1420 [Marchantia polymorpha subsp. ruderalis]|uniref:Reverse transcriptase Ty1/copia-type domain-containing protein n=1 Tax=Marchantia polymorpha subsp. ruderalis TaxID=1480154 RepID=A0A176VLL8_MARPO|nr:hypothetical protein AXG93_4012s1420 [Marchantia polymorpha subsp. ruderalis]